MKVLGGSSRVSVATLRKSLDEIVNKQSASDAAIFASELFTILLRVEHINWCATSAN
jgi:hypothetical protein